MSNKIVGQGSYGCVIKPALKCDNEKKIKDKHYKNKVSKIMFDRHAKDELKELKFLSKLAGVDQYAVSMPKICNPKLDNNFKKIVEKCKSPPTAHVYYYFRNKQSRLKQLLLEDGGINMQESARILLDNKKIDMNELKIFFTSFLNLFDGLIFFSENNVIHFDIKLINLVYNFETGVSKYIDFGLMKTREKVIREYTTNSAHYAIRHFNWPPENEFGLKSHFNNYEYAKPYRDHFGDHSNFLKKLVKTFDSWGLCTALLEIFNYAIYRDIKHKNFIIDVIKLLSNFREHLINRKDNLYELYSSYAKLLKDHNIYTTKSKTYKSNLNTNIKNKVDSIKNSNIDNDILKLKCKEKNKDFNPLTKRCLKKCKSGFERNEKYRCVKIKTQKNINNIDNIENNKNIVFENIIKHQSDKKNITNRSIEKRIECTKKNKEYNPITKRCNIPCKQNQIRDNNFKCVTKKKYKKK
tara:strand:+ start:18420 stop:19817 length:1398 start_codon:yes stop_codon:yes gene_type:complete